MKDTTKIENASDIVVPADNAAIEEVANSPAGPETPGSGPSASPDATNELIAELEEVKKLFEDGKTAVSAYNLAVAGSWRQLHQALEFALKVYLHAEGSETNRQWLERTYKNSSHPQGNQTQNQHKVIRLMFGFGDDRDKGRVSEYASVLKWAKVNRGDAVNFAAYLDENGGVSGVKERIKAANKEIAATKNAGKPLPIPPLARFKSHPSIGVIEPPQQLDPTEVYALLVGTNPDGSVSVRKITPIDEKSAQVLASKLKW